MLDVYLSDIELKVGSISTVPRLWDGNREPHDNVTIAIMDKATKEDYIKNNLEHGYSMEQIEYNFKVYGDKYFYYVSID